MYGHLPYRSAGGMTPSYGGMYPALQEGEKKGIQFFDALGVKTVQEARKIDAKVILGKALDFSKIVRGRCATIGPIL